jgi:hypothetical protein
VWCVVRQRKIEEFNFFLATVCAHEPEITRADASFCFLFVNLTPPYKMDVFSCKGGGWEWGAAPVHAAPVRLLLALFSFWHFSSFVSL